MSPKPLIPTDAEIAVVDRVWSGLSGLDEAITDSVPAKVRDSLTYLSGVGAVLDAIRTDQPHRLEPYAESLVQVLRGAGLDEGAAYDALSAVFSSVPLARLLADVAAGNVEPVAAVRKSKPAPVVRKKAEKVVEVAVEEAVLPAVVPEPDVDEVIEPVDDEPDVVEQIVPDDFDLPVADPAPSPEPVAVKTPRKRAAKRPAVVPDVPETAEAAEVVDF
mgnify:CR=1 FL=1